MIEIDYSTEVDEEDPDQPELINVEVLEATTKYINFQMTYSNPFAVSREPTVRDRLTISFDKRFFSDPETDFEINEGENLIIELPR